MAESAASTYNPRQEYTSKVLTRGTAEYEFCRRNNASADTPERYPREIHVVHTAADVSAALKRAADLGVSVGVRSGGHLYSCGALVAGGILIDTTHLNRYVELDEATKEVSFGPAVRARELFDFVSARGRFYPTGRAPTVAAGGFHLAGGQGWFARGWGATCQTWLTRLEIVVPDGRVMTASRTENRELFWAARGSGTGFFGVVTRFWGRTVRASRAWERSLTFELGDMFKSLAAWALDRAAATPKYGTDLNIGIMYGEKFAPDRLPGDEIPKGARPLFMVFALCYTDTIREAETLLSAFGHVPAELRGCLVQEKSLGPLDFDEFWKMQDVFTGSGHGERWQINSIASEPSIPLADLLEALEPALTSLPTLMSSVIIAMADIVPDGEDAAFSLPQQLYISAFTGWVDPARQPAVRHHYREHFKRLLPVSCGMYVADYDVTCDDANSRVMSETALARFLTIRANWDPNGLFPNYKRFVETNEKMKRLLGESKSET